MSTKERILTIRLMEKISRDPQCAKALGIQVQQVGMKPESGTALDRTEE